VTAKETLHNATSPFVEKGEKGIFMWSFCAKNSAKTPQAGQTNDSFDPRNLDPELHRLKSLSIMAGAD